MADSAAVAPARVVGIGASAGGLEAFTALLRHFELDSMAFVVIQHLAPDQPSILPELLERVTPMKVVTATHGARVLTNHVYIIPPGKALRIEDDVLQLAPFDETNRARPTIDIFFRSLAEDLRSRAAGVVLSGNGSDGTLGLKEIKDAGGITFVQDPATAQFDGMPRSAIDKGVADYVLPPREIAKELMRLSKHPDTRFPAEDAAPQREGLTRLFAMMRHAFGVNLAYYKPSTLERRVSRRMVLQKVDTLDEYVTYLERTPEELDVLYRDLLIGVTNFFRDGTPFDALKTAVFPLMMADKRLGDAIRIWSPGCSTGEEVYSLAIALLELLGPTSADYKIQIFGTDLDETAIQFARRGVYHESITLDVSADRLQRFFTRHGATYQVNRRVRDLIVFSSQDLTHDAPFSHLDVVSCRNVLIYLQPEVQKRVLRIFHYALAPSGFMLLGSSETVGDASELFTVVDRGNKIFGKRSVVPHGPLELAFVSSRNNGRNEPALVGLRRPLANIQQLADRKVLERYGPPGIVVNENLEIVQFRGRTGGYLEPAPGAATFNLMKLARSELLPELRHCIQQAMQDTPAVSGRVKLRERDQTRVVNIDVIPLIEPETKTRCFLVVFRDERPHVLNPNEATVLDSASHAAAERVGELERELAVAKEYLQTTIEELEASNEELKAANEELQSANEELQSTNEELETAKEELQATNEELTTVNEELNSRMSELTQATDDIQNVAAYVSSVAGS